MALKKSKWSLKSLVFFSIVEISSNYIDVVEIIQLIMASLRKRFPFLDKIIAIIKYSILDSRRDECLASSFSSILYTHSNLISFKHCTY